MSGIGVSWQHSPPLRRQLRGKTLGLKSQGHVEKSFRSRAFESGCTLQKDSAIIHLTQANLSLASLPRPWAQARLAHRLAPAREYFARRCGPRAQRARTTDNKVLLGSFGFHVPYARKPGKSGCCERDPPAGPGYPPVPPCRLRTTAAGQTPSSPVVPAVGGER